MPDCLPPSELALNLEKALVAYVKISSLSDWDADVFVRGGSCQRGVLLTMIAVSEGVDERLAEQAAIGVELLHNASLVHDDIIDEDIERRGRPSAYGAMGSGRALLFGDVLIAEAYACIAGLDVASGLRVRLVQILSQVISNASLGQVMQLGSDPSTACTLEACMEWSRQKTGVLFALPVEAALILAGKADEAKLAKSAATEIGLAYQIKDDMLDWQNCKRGRSTATDVESRQWTFAKIAQRDYPGAEIAIMQSWIRDAEVRAESVAALLSPNVRYHLKCLGRKLLQCEGPEDTQASIAK